MRFRKLYPRIPIFFLAIAFSLIVSTAPALRVWAETPVILDQYVPMRDGVVLFTKVFLPDPAVWGSGPYPTILSTTPYGVGVPGVPPSTWPSQPLNGYAYVYQDSQSGKGDGPRAGEFQPRPTDFTNPQVMQAIAPAKFEKSVVEGLPNVAWHTFGNLLTPRDVGDVTKYVRSFIR